MPAMTDEPAPAPREAGGRVEGPAEGTPKPPANRIDALAAAVSARAPEPKKATHGLRYSHLLVLVLIACCAVLIFFGMRHRAEAGRLLGREKRSIETLSRVEHMRSLLARADRIARYPGLTPRDVDQVRGFADNVIERVSDTLEKGRASDLEILHRLRGRAYELKHEFDDAQASYEEAIKLVPAGRSPAFFDRGFVNARRLLRALLLDPPKASIDALVRELEDLRRGVATTDDELLRDTAGAAYAIGNTEFDEAIALAKGGLVLDEGDWWCLLLRGVALMKQKKLKEALDDLNLASRNYPYGAEILAWRAACLVALGEKVRGMDALGSALQVDGHFFEAYVLRGRLLFADGQYEAARQHFANAALLRVDSAECHLGAATSAHEAWLRSDKKDATPLDGAAQAATLYIGLAPTDAAGFLLRAKITLARGDAGRESAERDANEAVKLAPSTFEPYLLRASARKDAAQSAEDFGLAAQRAPDRAARNQALHERARALVRAGQKEKARGEFDELLKESPEHVALAIERAQLLLSMAALDEALAAVDTILKEMPVNSRACGLRAEILLARNDAKGAVAAATTAWGLDPTWGDPLIVRGTAQAKLGDKESARKDWLKARELLPSRAAELDALLRTLE